MFDKKDKKSEKIQKNFSDFWSKFVTFAPEVSLRLLVLVQARTRAGRCLSGLTAVGALVPGS